MSCGDPTDWSACVAEKPAQPAIEGSLAGPWASMSEANRAPVETPRGTIPANEARAEAGRLQRAGSPTGLAHRHRVRLADRGSQPGALRDGVVPGCHGAASPAAFQRLGRLDGRGAPGH